MADENQLKRIMEEGVASWNEWREQYPDTEIDLRNANLEGVILNDINLKGSSLENANLKTATLKRANLERADLYSANLVKAKLNDTNLKEAILDNANLNEAVLENVNLEKAALYDTNLTGADLNHANLKEAILDHSNLEKVDLYHANLEGAILDNANLKDAGLNFTNLERADLYHANLEGAILNRANLKEAKLDFANLKKVELDFAILDKTILHNANLEDTDLRLVRGLLLDSTFIRNARFSPRAIDPWSVIRSTYTGPKFTFQLLALIIFALPYIGKTVFWSFVNRGQGYTQNLLEVIRQRATELKLDDLTITTLGLSPEKITSLSQCLSDVCERRSAWQLLLGTDQSGLFWLLPLTLVIYNVLRGILTYQVAPMRDEEERSGYSPAWIGDKWWKGYRISYNVHRVVFVLGYIAIAAFIYNAWHWLGLPIYLPA